MYSFHHEVIRAGADTGPGGEIRVVGLDQPDAKVIQWSTVQGGTIVLKIPGHAYNAGFNWSVTGAYAKAEYQVHVVRGMEKRDGWFYVHTHNVASFDVRS